jgi:hypothetical protein
MFRIKDIIIAIGIACLISNSIVLFYTFFIAYLNDYKVLIHINNFGEAHLEFFFIPISIVLGIYSVFSLYTYNLKMKNQNKTVKISQKDYL